MNEIPSPYVHITCQLCEKESYVPFKYEVRIDEKTDMADIVKQVTWVKDEKICMACGGLATRSKTKVF